MPPFPRDSSRADINSLLNDDPAPQRAHSRSTHPSLIVDRAYSQELIDTIVQQTSGHSVEQLEQVYSALMSEIWRTRGEWDRRRVAGDVAMAFEEVEADINVIQNVSQWSMEKPQGVPLLEGEKR